MNIVILGLEARQDRWQRCLEILEREGIKKVTHYTTVRDFTDTWGRATRDFLQLLRIKRGEELLFFEDDFELTEGWRDVFDKARSELPQDYDMLYLGINLTKKPKKESETLYRVRGGWCLHGVLMSPKFIDFVLREFDPAWRQVFDEWCRVVAEKRKFYMTYPMICYQRESFSDYVGKNVFYDIFNNKYYKEL